MSCLPPGTRAFARRYGIARAFRLWTGAAETLPRSTGEGDCARTTSAKNSGAPIFVWMDLPALVGDRSLRAAGGLLLATKRPPVAACSPVAGRIGATASTARTSSGSRLHPDLDRCAASDSGSGAGSAAAARESDLRARSFEFDFPGQQHAGF